MNYDNSVVDKLVKNYTLLCSIVAQGTSSPKMKADLSKIEAIINKTIPAALKKKAPDDFYELFVDFKAEYERFRDFILYDKLIGKNIVALGGGFSSGKSSFLNALMGRNVLPADIDPSTSVPTYIVKGAKHEVMGINVFDSKVCMQPYDIKKIAHGFGDIEDDDERFVTGGVTLGHVLKTVFFSTPLHTFDSIAFLDTPGYSKPDSEKYSAKTDEQIARGQLNSSNYILWFVQADAGTITDEDIRFITSLRPDIPLLVVVNKADKKTRDDLAEIITKVKSNLDMKSVPYLDVLAFSDRLDQIDDSELRAFVAVDANKIHSQLDEWNRQVYESNFARNFKKIFVRCHEYYESEIVRVSRQLHQLNVPLTFLNEGDTDDDVMRPLVRLAKQAQREANMLKAIEAKLNEVQQEFFTEIKSVADIVGIAMPEPSEIDLLQENNPHPWQVFDRFRRAHGLRSDRALVKALQTIFAGIMPRMERYQGRCASHKGEITVSDLQTITKQAWQASPPLLRDLLDWSTPATKRALLGCLAFIVSLDNSEYSNQMFYLCRLARGCKYKATAEDLQKLGLKFVAAELDQLEQDVGEFKYVLLVEAFVLANLCGPCSRDTLEVLADLAGHLEVGPEELRVLGLFAKGLLLNEQIESIAQEIALAPEFTNDDVQTMFLVNIITIYAR